MSCLVLHKSKVEGAIQLRARVYAAIARRHTWSAPNQLEIDNQVRDPLPPGSFVTAGDGLSGVCVASADGVRRTDRRGLGEKQAPQQKLVMRPLVYFRLSRQAIPSDGSKKVM